MWCQGRWQSYYVVLMLGHGDTWGHYRIYRCHTADCMWRFPSFSWMSCDFVWPCLACSENDECSSGPKKFDCPTFSIPAAVTAMSVETKPFYMAIGLDDFNQALSVSAGIPGKLPARPLYPNVVSAIAAACLTKNSLYRPGKVRITYPYSLSRQLYCYLSFFDNLDKKVPAMFACFLPRSSVCVPRICWCICFTAWGFVQTRCPPAGVHSVRCQPCF